MEFKDKIKSRREELKLTLEEVAKIVGVTVPTIHRYETGEISNPGSRKIALLSKALQVSPAYLMDWEELSAKDDTKIITIAARLADENLTKDEMNEVFDYAKYIKSKRNKG